jgi:adenosylcobinamide-GDP ribazoletransferase
MKDSRLGTFGTVGLLILLVTQALLLEQLLQQFLTLTSLIVVFTAWQMWSRVSPVVLMRMLPYAREEGDSKAKPIAQKHYNSDTFIALITALIPLLTFIFISKETSVWLIIAGILPVWYFYRLSKKWLGGYTGDVLGASQQLTAWCFLFIIKLGN